MARTPLFRVFIRLLAQAQASPVQGKGLLHRRSLRRKSVLSRRQLLKYSALAGGTALGTAVGLPALAQQFPNLNRSRIAIVGGGIAGLNAAYQLRKLGTRATVYAAKAYVGGRIQSRQNGVSPYLYIESRNPAERQNVNVGNLVFAGEQFSDEFYGFMNGAAQTGRLAAAVVLSRMHQV